MARQRRDSPFDTGPRWFDDEDEDEEKEVEKPNTSTTAGKAKAQYGLTGPQAGPETDSQKIQDLIHQTEVLIEQLGHLYQMYFAGAEERPPVEKRTLLEKYVTQINQAFKGTPTLKFKCQQILSTYQTHRDLWDRKLKDIETGKLRPILRKAGPKR